MVAKGPDILHTINAPLSGPQFMSTEGLDKQVVRNQPYGRPLGFLPSRLDDRKDSSRREQETGATLVR